MNTLPFVLIGAGLAGIGLSGRTGSAARAEPGAALTPEERQRTLLPLQNLLAHLRALRWHYQTVHWTAGGPTFYGDHLLFQRLYAGDQGGPDIGESIDALGERMVAYLGPDSVADAAIVPLFQAAIPHNPRTPIEGALALEQATQQAVSIGYRSLEQAGTLSLGLDDFLMALANARDTALYLLQRRLAADPNTAATR